jgi:hypothetical protein
MTEKIEVSVIPALTYCPVVECSECDAAPCPFASRAGRIAEARAAYDEADKNLRVAADNLRAVISHGYN